MNEPSPPERDAPLVDWSSREIEPGSFRDRNGRVFYRDNAVFRGLSQKALENWELLSSKEFFHRLLADRKVEVPSGLAVTALRTCPNCRDGPLICGTKRFLLFPTHMSGPLGC